MNFHLRKIDLLAIGIAAILLLTLSLTGYLILGSKMLIISLSIAVGLVLFVQGVVHSRIIKMIQTLHQAREQDYKQIEAMLSLLSVIKINHPLPPMRVWAISPDFANIIISTILDRTPKTIVECGAGVSTLLMAYCIKNLGQGKIWSLEHDEKYAVIARRTLKTHKLENMATVIHAPLKEISLGGKSWLWYDTSFLGTINAIDLLIIDGPPGNIQKMSRYPALPILLGRLSKDAIILLDDSAREDEKQIIQKWLNEFNAFECEWRATEKGATILTRISRTIM